MIYHLPAQTWHQTTRGQVPLCHFRERYSFPWPAHASERTPPEAASLQRYKPCRHGYHRPFNGPLYPLWQVQPAREAFYLHIPPGPPSVPVRCLSLVRPSCTCIFHLLAPCLVIDRYVRGPARCRGFFHVAVTANSDL